MAAPRYENHTDSVAEKVRLLQSAVAAGNLDVAMSLAASLKETLAFERQRSGTPGEPTIKAESIPVRELPPMWAAWASGWGFCKPITLSETVGIERVGEPVELTMAFRTDQTSDLPRELRVVRVDPRSGTLHTIPSQICDEVLRGTVRHCRLMFLADVPMHGQATYLVFHGNPLAELPEYATDLRAEGEGYGLDIENRHYVAKLSRQMGQLERLRYKADHGLELFAGGKGHGEPPTVDWSHDYADEGHFQKLRIRAWPACPNYEVVKGPICVRVRRWGFPVSPLHPVFAPSRLHFDQTYSFYAGVPWFVKQARIDAVKDVAIAAMRDEEWVFSGYSFTDLVWLDRQGKLHEGKVPPAQADDLWGIGYYHRDSRDAFVALYLKHEAVGFDGLKHNGSPTLHYPAHGQVWSRYPSRAAELKAGTSFQQQNAYAVFPFGNQDGAKRLEQLRHQLLNPLDVRAGAVPRMGAARSPGALARPGETAASGPLKLVVWAALREVRDEQLYNVDANIVDMGYVYDVRERDGIVEIVLTMPHRGRPVSEFLQTAGGGRVKEGLQERLRKIAGVRDVVVRFTWEPAWSLARITPAGRLALGLPESPR